MRIKLEIPLSIKEICECTDARLQANIHVDKCVNSICTDTRECQNGDLFIALQGVTESGEKYITEALKKNCLVLSSLSANDTISVNDTTDALLKIAELYKKKVVPKHTIAVTGSVGKSTTVKFISTVLSQKYKVHSPNGNYNNHIGVPLTILSMPRDTEVLVLEFGMNHSGEISRLSKCAAPDIGIITTIGTSHIGNLGSREKIALAKLEILDGMTDGKLLLPCDEPLLRNMKHGLFVGCNSSLSDFSLDNSDKGYRFRSMNTNINEIEFFDHREHMTYNLSFAIAVSDILGLSKEEIINGVKAITSSNLSQRFIRLKNFTIFDDSYNASLESIREDLKYISSLGRPTGAFLGDVLELGDKSADIHEEIGRLAARFNIGHLYLYGDYAKYIANGAIISGISKDNVYINPDISSPETSISHIRNYHSDNEIILFKASHKLRLDKIADMIENEERINNEQR